LRLGLYDEALELAGRAGAAEHPAVYHRILGLAAWKRSDAATAVEHLVQAESGPDVMEALLNGYLALGRLREASEHLSAAEKIDKPTAGLRRSCERVRQLQARRTQLEKVAPPPEGKAKEWAAALDSLACAEGARAAGRSRSRIDALLKQVFAHGLEPGPAFALRGRLALDSGKLGKALSDAERAIALTPRDPGGWFVRGRVRLERGDKEALADLAKAAELSGRQDADILHALAEALSRAGRVEQALIAQRAAVKLKPKDAEMAEQLRALEKEAKKTSELSTPRR